MEHEEKNEEHAHHNHEEHTPEIKKNKSMNATVLVFGHVGTLVVAMQVYYGIVQSQVKKFSTEPYVLKSANFLRIPAVKAQGESLSYTDYITDLNSLKKLSANPAFSFGPATDQEISDLVVANFLTRVKTEQLAKKYNISVSPDEVAKKKAELISQFGEESVKQSIQSSYGWDLDTFVKKIIEPSLLNEKVRENFSKSTDPEATQYNRDEAHVYHILIGVNDPTNAKEKDEKKKVAAGVLARLKKGEDFAKVATEVSTDTASKPQGGDLGWVPKGGTVEEFDKVAFSIELNKISDIVETSYGYHILKVTERRVAPDFDAFMDVEVKKMEPKFYLNIHNPLESLPVTPSTNEVQDASSTAK